MRDRRIFYLHYDVDSTAFKYGHMLGMHQGTGGIRTAGSTVTVSAIVPGALPFAPLVPGDFIWMYPRDAAVLKRRVLTKPTNDQITVDALVDLSAGIASWYFLPFRVGSTDEDGWLPVEAPRRAWVEFEVAALGAPGGVDYQVEVRGRAPATKGIPVATGNVAAPGGKVVEVTDLLGSVRVGLKAATAPAGTDDISVFLTGDNRW